MKTPTNGQDLFQVAEAVFPDIIERLFYRHGAHWSGDEYWTLNPLRDDHTIGSFSISKQGLWNDFADGNGGTGIELVAKWKGISLPESARFIVNYGNGEPTIATVNDENHKENTKSRKTVISHISQMKFSPPDWLIYGMVENRSLSMVYGNAGSFKTFAVLDMALCVASGEPWHGHQTTQGSVLYVFGEGRGGLRKRLQAWGLHHDLEVDHLPFYFPENTFTVGDLKSIDEKIEAIQQAVAPPLKLIIFDTMNRVFGVGDENNTSDMTRFVNICDYYRKELGCAIVIVHHTGHSDKGRARGSSVLNGALDTEFQTTKTDDTHVTLKNTKMKDHQPPKDLAFEVVDVGFGFPDEHGNELTGAVLVQTELPSSKKTPRTTEREAIVLSILKNRLEELPEDSAEKGLQKTEWSKLSGLSGIESKPFYKLVDSLTRKGFVLQSESGSYIIQE